MGTNYYLHDKPPCACCKREYEPRHIGKSSAGWCFALHVIPEDDINTIDDWRSLWSKSGCYIADEYGAKIEVDEMEKIITDRERLKGSKLTDDWLSANWAVRGPNGLARHKVDGVYCLGHGDGTWDYTMTSV